jgi:DNA-binding NarL/FixJ family response regulator
MHPSEKKTVAVCETQPLTAEGMRALLAASSDLEFLARLDSLPGALDLVRQKTPAVLILDKAFGAQSVLECLEALRALGAGTAPVVWGISITEAEALRFVQAGAKGVIRKSADAETVVSCLRSVARGDAWMEPGLFHPRWGAPRAAGPELTPRERQILELVALGLKNREIANELGIRPGTVKVHLKHIFEKTGVRGRFGLAVTGMETGKPTDGPPSGTSSANG